MQFHRHFHRLLIILIVSKTLAPIIYPESLDYPHFQSNIQLGIAKCLASMQIHDHGIVKRAAHAPEVCVQYNPSDPDHSENGLVLQKVHSVLLLEGQTLSDKTYYVVSNKMLQILRALNSLGTNAPSARLIYFLNTVALSETGCFTIPDLPPDEIANLFAFPERFFRQEIQGTIKCALSGSKLSFSNEESVDITAQFTSRFYGREELRPISFLPTAKKYVINMVNEDLAKKPESKSTADLEPVSAANSISEEARIGDVMQFATQSRGSGAGSSRHSSFSGITCPTLITPGRSKPSKESVGSSSMSPSNVIAAMARSASKMLHGALGSSEHVAREVQSPEKPLEENELGKSEKRFESTETTDTGLGSAFQTEEATDAFQAPAQPVITDDSDVTRPENSPVTCCNIGDNDSEKQVVCIEKPESEEGSTLCAFESSNPEALGSADAASDESTLPKDEPVQEQVQQTEPPKTVKFEIIDDMEEVKSVAEQKDVEPENPKTPEAESVPSPSILTRGESPQPDWTAPTEVESSREEIDLEPQRPELTIPSRTDTNDSLITLGK